MRLLARVGVYTLASAMIAGPAMAQTPAPAQPPAAKPVLPKAAPPGMQPQAALNTSGLLPPTPAVDEGEAHSHLLKRVDPVYGDAAQEANVVGTVVLRVTVDQGGHVAHITPVSGPVLLVPNASEAVRHWIYTPFTIDGAVKEIHTTVRVPFGELATQAEEQRLLSEYRPLWKECAALVGVNTDPAKQVSACRLAAGQAAQFAPDTRPVERREADQYYALALSRAGSFAPALAWAAKALPLFGQDPADPGAANTTLLLLAQARIAAGDVPGANHDLAEAEAGLREALQNTDKTDLKRRYADALKKSLQFHASILTLLRKPAEAQGKLHEADAL